MIFIIYLTLFSVDKVMFFLNCYLNTKEKDRKSRTKKAIDETSRSMIISFTIILIGVEILKPTSLNLSTYF